MGDTDNIGDWLAHKNTKPLLDRIALGVERWLRYKQINPSFLPHPSCGGYDQTPESITGRIEEIRSELQCFILEKGPELQSLILAGNDGIEKIIRHAFQNHLLDGVRNLGVDPFRYFYKRAGQVLRESGQFQKSLKSGRFFMFSLKTGAVSGPPLTEEELEKIAFPADCGLDFKKLCGQEALTFLAAYFWREVSGMRAADPWIDLRDFVNWTLRNVVMSGVEIAPGDDEGGGSMGNSAAPSAEGAEDTAGPYAALRADEIRRLAACFAARLEPEIKAAMYYRDVLDLGWKEIAQRTGHSGPSGPMYAYKAGRNRMEAFIRDQRKLSPEDFDPRDYEVFCEALQQVLKESFSEP